MAIITNAFFVKQVYSQEKIGFSVKLCRLQNSNVHVNSQLVAYHIFPLPRYNKTYYNVLFYIAHREYMLNRKFKATLNKFLLQITK